MWCRNLPQSHWSYQSADCIMMTPSRQSATHAYTGMLLMILSIIKLNICFRPFASYFQLNLARLIFSFFSICPTVAPDPCQMFPLFSVNCLISSDVAWVLLCPIWDYLWAAEASPSVEQPPLFLPPHHIWLRSCFRSPLWVDDNALSAHPAQWHCSRQLCSLISP